MTNTLPERPLLLVVAAALIDKSKVLLAERPAGKSLAGLWEFPGGKLDAGETAEDALVRELREELGINVGITELTPFTFASHSYPKFHLLMPLYTCHTWKGIPTAQEGQRLAWATKDELQNYPMPPADIPLVTALMKIL